MSEPPPCLTVCLTVRRSCPSILRTQHQERPSELNLFIFVSSDHTTRSHSAIVQNLWCFANASLSAIFFFESNGFETLTDASKPASKSARRTVSSETNTLRSVLRRLLACTAVSSSPDVKERTGNRLFWTESFAGRPILWVETLGRCSFLM